MSAFAVKYWTPVLYELADISNPHGATRANPCLRFTMAAVSVTSCLFKLFFFSFHWQFIKHLEASATTVFFPPSSFYPTTINGILINSKNHPMTWKGRNEVFYTACNLQRVVWVFRWNNHGGRFATRHEHNRSAFVCRRRAGGQMKRPSGNNGADVKHCGSAVSLPQPAQWDRKWKAASAESRQWAERLVAGLLCAVNRVSWWRWSTAPCRWTQMKGFSLCSLASSSAEADRAREG